MDWYKFRNSILHFLYVKCLKPLLFLGDPEHVHDLFLSVGSFLGSFSLGRWKTKMLFGYTHPTLSQTVEGIEFKNPIGLAAGFDKDGVLIDIISSVGFGFAEVGSVTAKASPGNQGKRLWRLKNSKSLGVWYGLKNNGAQALAHKMKGKTHQLPIGVSVAMTNCRDNLEIDSAIKDYVEGFKTVESVSDYVTINISCPNTLGGQPFIIPENFHRLMTVLDTVPTMKPVFVKISPDMTHESIDEFLDICKKHRINGIICSNLTKAPRQIDLHDPMPPHGGVSGKLVFPKAMDLLSYMYKKVGDRFTFVFCGGVFSADDAYKAIRNGASLIQMITGMIFEGPQTISSINLGLVDLLSRDGFHSISEAVGVDNRS